MRPLSERQWQFLDTLAARIVPPTTSLDEAGRERFRAIIAHALSAREPAMVRQLKLFLTVLRLAPKLRFGVTLDNLDAERQDAVLRAFQDSPLAKLRQGMWGVKTLIFMGYYAQPEVSPSLRYTPSFSGNEMLHG